MRDTVKFDDHSQDAPMEAVYTKVMDTKAWALASKSKENIIDTKS